MGIESLEITQISTNEEKKMELQKAHLEIGCGEAAGASLVGTAAMKGERY